MREQWLESEIVAEPIKAKDLDGPRVLVRRRHPLLVGSRNEELVYLDGQPAISLFTGAGGMDLGLEMAGFCCLVQVEWEKECCETLLDNRPRFFRHAALIQGDIRGVPTGTILGEAGLRVGEAAIVHGGPPCQGFSTCGKRQLGDQRNDLVFEFLRVVRQVQPSFFFFENVPGFVSFNKGSYMRQFLETAYGCYFELVYGLVNAVEYGVPQDRTRFICMGTRRDLVECDGIIGSLPKPQCFGRADLELLGSLSGPLFDAERESLTRAPGIRYFPDRPVLTPPRPTMGTNFKSRTKTFLDFYRKLEEEEPDRIVREPVHANF